MKFMSSALTKIKEVLAKMGLIRTVRGATQLRDIPVDESFYREIEQWLEIYKGYHPSIHDIKTHTIGGTRKEKLKSLRMAKVASQELATLVFNERCEINVSNVEFSEFIENVLYANNFQTNMQSSLEFAFASGGMVIKPYVDNGEIKLSYVTADAFIPLSWDASEIKEAVFPYETIKGKYKYTHLEWHLWSIVGEGENRKKVYTIKNELYRTDSKMSDLGYKVPLDELFEDLDEEVTIGELEHPLFVYIKPNNANFVDHKLPLGVSVFAHAIDTLQLIDTAYDSFFREFKLGRRRIIVPASAVRSVMDDNGNFVRYFDASDEVYQAMDIGDMDNNKITDNTVSLRIDEHISAINALLDTLSMQLGFSAGSFSFDGTGVKTATEVVSENSKTFRTKQSHEIMIEEGLCKLVDAIGALANLYELFNVPDDYDVSVAFDDSIAEDKTAETDREINLVLNGLQSKVRALMKIHGITKDEAIELLQEISEEASTVGMSDLDIYGLSGTLEANGDTGEGTGDGDDNQPPMPNGEED